MVYEHCITQTEKLKASRPTIRLHRSDQLFSATSVHSALQIRYHRAFRCRKITMKSIIDIDDAGLVVLNVYMLH